jgi:hypothetical protein
MCTEQEYQDFKDGKSVMVSYGCVDRLASKEVAPEWYDGNMPWDEYVKMEIKEGDAYTYDAYRRQDYEFFNQTYVTPGGEKIVAFGVFGSDY